MSSSVDTMEGKSAKADATRPQQDVSTAKIPAATGKSEETLVPARLEEVEAVHRMVIDAIETSPFYNDEFKAFETGRLTPAYLIALMHVDPRHVMTIRDKGELAGFMLSGPEYGVLWQYWNYVDPKFRSGTLAMRAMRNYLPLWENDRFHKIMTYSRPENRVSIALMERYKYRLVAELKQHMFGQDYLLYEHDLTKGKPGYDNGVSIGAAAKLRYRLGRVLPFLNK